MISLKVNGKKHNVDVVPDASLLWVLRDVLKLKGAKFGCGVGECGSCIVHVDGMAERSCGMTVEEALGKEITTVEGLAADHPVKRAWIEEQTPQCGYCQPGQMMQAAALLAETPTPDADKIIGEMDGVLCRCGSYPRIKRGIEKAVELTKREGRSS